MEGVKERGMGIMIGGDWDVTKSSSEVVGSPPECLLRMSFRGSIDPSGEESANVTMQDVAACR
jgi:hypothetical protein